MTAPELQAHVEHYLTVQTTLGFRLQAERTLLLDFVRFATQRHPGEPLRAVDAVDWACLPASRGHHAAPAQRLSMVRRFLTYLRAHAPATEVPAHHLIAVARRRPPYLFTADEIAALLQAASLAGPARSLRPHTLTTLLGVLASTGIRIGEALGLQVPDVQLEEDPARLRIAQTKFHKSRWVPLHPTTARQLQTYRHQRQHYFSRHTHAPFFLSATGEPLHHDSVLLWFSKTCRRLGIWPSDDGRRPCLHSFRHTFAVQRLRCWYEEGADVHRLLPHLSVYLGHVRKRSPDGVLSYR